MIRQITYQPKDSEEMKTKWIFRDDGDLSKDYSDFKTMEVMLNRIYDVLESYPVSLPLEFVNPIIDGDEGGTDV